MGFQRSPGGACRKVPALSSRNLGGKYLGEWGWQRTKMGTHPSNVGRAGKEAGGDFGWILGLGDPGSLPSLSLCFPSFSSGEHLQPGAGVVGQRQAL